MSKYPPATVQVSPDAVWITVSVISFTGIGVPIWAGSSVTDPICCTIKSFCMSSRKSWSMVNSKNSQSTPIVMEKQKATSVR